MLNLFLICEHLWFAKLFEPVALSVRLESVSGVAKVSVTVKPTRALSSIEFVLKIKVCADF